MQDELAGQNRTAETTIVKRHGMIASMSRRGNCYDNAVAESFFSSLKNELVHHTSFKTRDEATTAIFEYIEVFYNRQRRLVMCSRHIISFVQRRSNRRVL